MKTWSIFLIVWMVLWYSGCIGKKTSETKVIHYAANCGGTGEFTQDTTGQFTGVIDCAQTLTARLKGECTGKLCPVGITDLIMKIEDPREATLTDPNNPEIMTKVRITSLSGISDFPYEVKLELKQEENR